MQAAGDHLLVLEEVTKRFGGLTALDRVSLRVTDGEIVGIIGPNGSGKTTLFSTITGFLKADGGRISFSGQPVLGLRPFRLCELGLVRTFQIVQPFGGLSVFDNVLVGAWQSGRTLEEAQDTAAETLRLVGLARFADTPAAALTLADRKRLELARALATGPRLILLDEIMAGLRPGEVDEAIALLKAIRDRGVTLVVVEHLMRAVLALSDRLYVLHHGSLIAEGLCAEVFQQQDVIDAYFGEQDVHH